MPAWLYDKRDLRITPSVKDGIDLESELKFRREGARLILDVGSDLSLRYDTMASGCVYFHRFFMFHSFKEFNRYVTAIGCLFLAGKVEETPKKCRDLLRAAKARLDDSQFVAFGDDPKEEVMAIERVLLQTIKFDLQVDHPYQFLIKYAKILVGSKTGVEGLVQMAWTFINDSLCTTICLQWEPEIIAIALMYLASRLSKFPINDWKNKKNVEGEKWWDQFVEDLSLETLEDICHQVLDLYSATGAGVKPRPPTSASGAPASVVATNGTSTNTTTTTGGSGSGTPSSQPSPAAPGGSTNVAPAVGAQQPAAPSSAAAQPTSTASLLVRRDSTKLPPTATVRGPNPTSSSVSNVMQPSIPHQPQPITVLQSQAGSFDTAGSVYQQHHSAFPDRPGAFPPLLQQQTATPIRHTAAQQQLPSGTTYSNHPVNNVNNQTPTAAHSRRFSDNNVTLVDGPRQQYEATLSSNGFQHNRPSHFSSNTSTTPFQQQRSAAAYPPQPHQAYNRLPFNNVPPYSSSNNATGSQYGRTYGRNYDL